MRERFAGCILVVGQRMPLSAIVFLPCLTRYHIWFTVSNVIDWNEIEQRISDTRVFYHPDAECTLRVSTVKRLLALRKDVVAIAETSVLPDGDHVNLSTQMWAEDWARGK